MRLDPSAEGVVVMDIVRGSTANQLGFQRGDVIVTVNDRPIEKTRDLDQVAKQSGRVWRIVVMRGGQKIAVQFGG
jgi:S1-C subfamily serine protease